MSTHKSCISSKSRGSGEDLTDQIDRLNQALSEVMRDIELSSVSQNPSRLSTLNNEFYQDSLYHTEEDSEDIFMPSNFESTIEDLLHTIDRQQMIIEDFRSEDKRILPNPEHVQNREHRCSHDLNKIRKQIWLQVSKQKGDLFEKERLKFQEELRKLDELKDDYYNKRSEILLGIEKLKIKEQLLEEKEKQLKMQKLTFDKQKAVWEEEHGVEAKAALFQHGEKKESHCRSASFSYSVVKQPPRVESQSKHLPMEIKPEQFSPTKHNQLKIYQIELKALEEQLRKSFTDDNSENEMKIGNLRNKIAALRGEIAISESSKASRLINSMMLSLQRDAVVGEKGKNLENGIRKNLFASRKPAPNPFQPIHASSPELKQEDLNIIQTPSEILLVKSPLNQKRERDEIISRQKALLDKEKEIAQREALLQETWMRIPGSKELIENVNLTLSRLHVEKANFEREREEFSKGKLEFFRTFEKSLKK
jgi:uncharacterized protein (DUF3084 family)